MCTMGGTQDPSCPRAGGTWDRTRRDGGGLSPKGGPGAARLPAGGDMERTATWGGVEPISAAAPPRGGDISRTIRTGETARPTDRWRWGGVTLMPRGAGTACPWGGGVAARATGVVITQRGVGSFKPCSGLKALTCLATCGGDACAGCGACAPAGSTRRLWHMAMGLPFGGPGPAAAAGKAAREPDLRRVATRGSTGADAAPRRTGGCCESMRTGACGGGGGGAWQPSGCGGVRASYFSCPCSSCSSLLSSVSSWLGASWMDRCRTPEREIELGLDLSCTTSFARARPRPSGHASGTPKGSSATRFVHSTRHSRLRPSGWTSASGRRPEDSRCGEAPEDSHRISTGCGERLKEISAGGSERPPAEAWRWAPSLWWPGEPMVCMLVEATDRLRSPCATAPKECHARAFGVVGLS
mmetsp:Transcript_85574/g.184700  ORF Transcript_85574/g.184700 Transcript_85574/m.184700 type:complete len:413 (+) Transcript_85574:116-1354(+)